MNSFLFPINEENAFSPVVISTQAFPVSGNPAKDRGAKAKQGDTIKGMKAVILATITILLVTFTNNANAQCYNTNSGYGSGWTTVTPSCSNQSVNPPSTTYTQFYPTAGVTYNISMTGTGWTTLAMTVYWDNGTVWTPYANNTGTGTLQVTPSAATLAHDGRLLISVYNGTSCAPNLPWVGNSATLNYSIATPTTPGITQNPPTGGQICNGSGVVYTASGITIGSFNQFVWGWNAVGGNALGIANGGTWVSNSPGNTLYVEAQSDNGGCFALSSPVTVLVDAASVVGSWGYPTLYYCNPGGYIYNAAGTPINQTITGNTGSSIGWQYGLNCAGWSTPVNQSNSTTSPWQCCFPSNPNSILATVQNGVCPPATSCFTFTSNGVVAPSTASVSPSNVCQGSSGTITLTYSGGNGGAIAGGALKWYSGSCGGTYVGSGQSLNIAMPSTTTNYYASWVDVCGNLSACASTTFTVTPTPVVSANDYSICMTGCSSCASNTTQITLTSNDAGTWASNNTGVLTVSGSTATVAGPGSTSLTFTMSSAPNCTATTPTVQVSALPVVNVTGPTSFCGTTTTTLSPTSGGTWVSNNTAVATVSGYTVTGTTAGGSTNFTFTSSTAPDCANATANVTVTGLPTVYGVTGGGTYCLGSSDPIGLSGSQSGVTYQLVYNGTTNVGSPMSGTGASLNFPNQTTLGTYTVVATTVTNSCSLPMSGSAVVTTLSPTVTNNPGATGVSPTGGTLNGTD